MVIYKKYSISDTKPIRQWVSAFKKYGEEGLKVVCNISLLFVISFLFPCCLMLFYFVN
jgi:hypothetical protein